MRGTMKFDFEFIIPPTPVFSLRKSAFRQKIIFQPKNLIFFHKKLLAQRFSIHLLPMIEVIVDDRCGKRARVKCSPSDTVGTLKLLVAAQIGTKPEKIVLKKAYIYYKDHITLDDYEVSDGFAFELYYA